MERKCDGAVSRIDRFEYGDILPSLKHVFLIGNLQDPSPHPFFREPRVELIVCSYEMGDCGLYHWHPDVIEYEFVIEGEISYFEVATGETHRFEAGDLVAVPAGVCVRRLVLRSARTLALKVPSLRETVHCRRCQRECQWRVEACQE